MVLAIFLGILFLAFICLGVWIIKQGEPVYGVVFIFIGVILIILCAPCLFEKQIYDVRDVKYTEDKLVATYDLVTLPGDNGKEANVIIDNEGFYYFITKEPNILGYGIESYQENLIDSSHEAVYVKVEDDVETPYVEKYARDIKMSAGSLALNDMDVYVLHVKEGNIVFASGPINKEK